MSGRKDGTTANERPWTMTTAEAAKRLGPLIRNQSFAMTTLDNFPTPCDCAAHSPLIPDLPDDHTTHRSDEPCPFEKDDFPIGQNGTCCSLRGKVAACELEAVGETALACRMFDDMTAEEAQAFSDELLAAADRLEREHPSRSLTGCGRNGTWNARTKEVVFRDCSTFDEVLASIREAGRWYRKVASLGYGVRAEHGEAGAEY